MSNRLTPLVDTSSNCVSNVSTFGEFCLLGVQRIFTGAFQTVDLPRSVDMIRSKYETGVNDYAH
jgi:hypothetical protein